MNSSKDTADRRFRLSWHREARLSQLKRDRLSFGVSRLRPACAAKRPIAFTIERSTGKRKLAQTMAMRPMRHDRNPSRGIENDLRRKRGNIAARLEQKACVHTGYRMRTRIFDHVANPDPGGRHAGILAGQPALNASRASLDDQHALHPRMQCADVGEFSFSFDLELP